jgi:23S rRNA pseudouridine2605 synthase
MALTMKRRRPPRPSVDSPASSSKSAPSSADSAPRGERLQKVLAAAGLGSRRQCEDLILTGRVEVDRQTVLELGTRVDPEKAQIRVDGVVLPQQRRVYYLLNKPMGVVTTNSDPSGRQRVIDLLPQDERVFPVGRLDKSSEGMLLVTNDGELANQLTHPRYGVEKTYQVLVAGRVGPEEMDKLRRGIFLAEGFAKVVRLTVKNQSKRGTLVEIVLDEGRNREIRRLLARVGHKVLRLKRIAIAGVRLGDLEPGEFRRLRPDELRELRQAARESRKRRFNRHAPAAAVVKRRPPAAATAAQGNNLATAAQGDQPTGAADTGGEMPVERSRFVLQQRPKGPRRRGKPGAVGPAAGKPRSGNAGTGKPGTGKPGTGKPIAGKPPGGKVDGRPPRPGGKASRRPPREGAPPAGQVPRGERGARDGSVAGKRSFGGKRPGGKGHSGGKGPSGGKRPGGRSTKGGRRP